MNYPPGTSLNDPTAPWNAPSGPLCELLTGRPVGQDRDGSLIYEDEDCNGEDAIPCPACDRHFCERHAAHDKRLTGCAECEREGALYLCTLCGETTPDGRVAWPCGNGTCVCEDCAAKAFAIPIETREAQQ